MSTAFPITSFAIFGMFSTYMQQIRTGSSVIPCLVFPSSTIDITVGIKSLTFSCFMGIEKPPIVVLILQ